MKTLAAGRKTVLCQNADSPFFYFGWPTVTRLPDGTLAMAASGFRLEHVCPFGKGVIAYSKDEGESWTHPAVVIDTPLDDRDCGLTCFGEGKVILSMVGALVIGSIRNILNLLSVNSFYQNILVGVIIIAVVAVSMMTRARRESRTAQFAAADPGALKE